MEEENEEHLDDIFKQFEDTKKEHITTEKETNIEVENCRKICDELKKRIQLVLKATENYKEVQF